MGKNWVFCSWSNDDGTENFVVIDKSDMEIESYQKGINPQQVELERKRLEKKWPGNLVDNDLDGKYGYHRVREYKIQSMSEMGETFSRGEEFLKMVYSCGKDAVAVAEMLKLIFGLLSAYQFSALNDQNLLESDEPIRLFRAPILACGSAEGTFPLLERVSRTLSVPISRDAYKEQNEKKLGDLVFHCPSVLPCNLCSKKIEEEAYVAIREDMEYTFDIRFPPIYRDTHLTINAAFYNRATLHSLVIRHPRTVLCYYGVRNGGLPIDPIRLNEKIFARFDCKEDWDIKKASILVRDYLAKSGEKILKRKEDKIEEYLGIARQAVEKNNRSRGSKKYRGVQKLWMEIIILTMRDFVRYGKKIGCWDKEEMERLQSEWGNLLLPGCFETPKVSWEEEDIDMRNIIIPQQDCVDVFMDAMNRLLSPELLSRYLFVPARTDFSGEKDGIGVLGYLRWYNGTKRKGKFLSLQIPEDLFFESVSSLVPYSCDWPEIIRQLRKKMPGFLHKAKTVRMRGLSDHLVPTLVLKIDAMLFLSPDKIEKLHSLAQ